MRDLGGAPADGATTTAPAGEGFTGTNVQVEGVDEADLVKTDGKRIFTLSTACSGSRS
jgi:inhibitor of cysteine peptidase